MNVKINAVKFKADEKLLKFVEEKVSKLDRHLPNAIEAEVTLKVETPETVMNKVADIRLVIRGNDLFASKKDNTFENAVLSAIDALKPQIEKLKDSR
ncbi:MAG: ribosome-associated translation inhibitor RaiA [Bacteroidales bacterium]|nr:ribosome-associated translation inhibitor RaiA [Bacteroidales bacterium]MBQ9313083.1 ribosome-associated translation inhibitor RaiA [Bacteroidales bacterium]